MIFTYEVCEVELVSSFIVSVGRLSERVARTYLGPVELGSSKRWLWDLRDAAERYCQVNRHSGWGGLWWEAQTTEGNRS